MREQRVADRRHLRAVRREIGTRRTAGKRKLWWRVALAGGLLSMAVLGVAFGQEFLDRPAGGVATVPLRQGSVEQAVTTDAFVVRTEQVYRAPTGGVVSRLVGEGERVRVGARAVSIAPGGAAPGAVAVVTPAADLTHAIDDLSDRIYRLAVAINQAKANADSGTAEQLQVELDGLSVRQWDLARQLSRAAAPAPSSPVPAAPLPAADTRPAGGTEITVDMAGVMLYQVDGLEEMLSPGGAAAWKPSWLRSLPAPTPRKIGTGEIAPGAPVFKVVDNLSISLLTVARADEVARLGDQTKVQVRLSGRDGMVTARIARREQEGEEVLLHLTAPVLPAELVGLRRVRVAIILGSYSGKVAPRSAIDVRDGLQGVWVQEGKKTAFHPARVLGGNQEEVILETELPPGTILLREAPRHMR